MFFFFICNVFLEKKKVSNKKYSFYIIKNVVLEPSRGNIYSSDNKILATSIPRYEIRWDATVINDQLFNVHKTSLIDSISSFLKISKAEVQKKIELARKNNNRYMLVAKNLTYSQYMRMKKFMFLAIQDRLFLAKERRLKERSYL